MVKPGPIKTNAQPPVTPTPVKALSGVAPAKQATPEPADVKPVDAKPVETKPVETKPVELKPIESGVSETSRASEPAKMPGASKAAETGPADPKRAAVPAKPETAAWIAAAKPELAKSAPPVAADATRSAPPKPMLASVAPAKAATAKPAPAATSAKPPSNLTKTSLTRPPAAKTPATKKPKLKAVPAKSPVAASPANRSAIAKAVVTGTVAAKVAAPGPGAAIPVAATSAVIAKTPPTNPVLDLAPSLEAMRSAIKAAPAPTASLTIRPLVPELAAAGGPVMTQMLGLARAFGAIQARMLDHACAELKATLGEVETIVRTESAADAVALQARAARRGYEAYAAHLKDLAQVGSAALRRG